MRGIDRCNMWVVWVVEGVGRVGGEWGSVEMGEEGVMDNVGLGMEG